MPKSIILNLNIDDATSEIAHQFKVIRAEYDNFEYSGPSYVTERAISYREFSLGSIVSMHSRFPRELGSVTLRKLDQNRSILEVMDPKWLYKSNEQLLYEVYKLEYLNFSADEQENEIGQFHTCKSVYLEIRDKAIKLLVQGLKNLSVIQRDGQREELPKKLEEIYYIDPKRIKKLRKIKSNLDLSKLLELFETVNLCFANKKYLAVAILGRAILDHIPPIFSAPNFQSVVENYNWSTSLRPTTKDSSAKKMIKRLDDSLKDLANHYLHGQIRNSKDVPEQTEVDFRAEFGILLAEIIRILENK